MASGACVDMMTVTPSSRLTRPSKKRNSRCALGSSWAVGSSSTSRRGRKASTAARLTSCCCPPESVSVAACRIGSMPKKCATSAMRRRIRSCGMPMFSSPKASSCQTVSQTICSAGSCMTKPMLVADQRPSAGESAALRSVRAAGESTAAQAPLRAAGEPAAAPAASPAAGEPAALCRRRHPRPRLPHRSRAHRRPQAPGPAPQPSHAARRPAQARA